MCRPGCQIAARDHVDMLLHIGEDTEKRFGLVLLEPEFLVNISRWLAQFPQPVEKIEKSALGVVEPSPKVVRLANATVSARGECRLYGRRAREEFCLSQKFCSGECVVECDPHTPRCQALAGSLRELMTTHTEIMTPRMSVAELQPTLWRNAVTCGISASLGRGTYFSMPAMSAVVTS
jgi:hypothetical protein